MTLTLAEAVLAAGTDDWVPLRAIDGLARRLEPNADPSEQHDRVLEAVRELLGTELVEVGTISGTEFSAWEGPLSASLARIEEAYLTQAPDEWGFAIWFNNTVLGDDIGRAALSREPDIL